MPEIQTAIEWYAWSVTEYARWMINDTTGVRGLIWITGVVFVLSSMVALFVGGRSRTRNKPAFDKDMMPIFLWFIPIALCSFAASFATIVVVAVWPIIPFGMAAYWLGKHSVARRCQCGRRLRSREKFCPKCGEKAETA